MPTINFKADVARFAEKAKLQTDLVVRKAVLEIFDGVVSMTPVDTGHARANWQVSAGEANGVEIPGAGDPRPAALSVIRELTAGPPVYIFNNVPYIETLEYGQYPNPPKQGTYLRKGQSKGGFTGPGWFQFSEGGFSKQAPLGMARVTVQRIAAQFNALVGVSNG